MYGPWKPIWQHSSSLEYFVIILLNWENNFYKIHSFQNQIKTWLNAEFLHNLHIWYFGTFESYNFISASFFKINNNFLDAPVCKQDAAQKILGISYKKPATILCEVMSNISLCGAELTEPGTAWIAAQSNTSTPANKISCIISYCQAQTKFLRHYNIFLFSIGCRSLNTIAEKFYQMGWFLPGTRTESERPWMNT